MGMKREFSAGGIVYKKIDGQILFLVRRSSGGENYRGNLGWTLPKGWIDSGETPEQAAVREVKEEGGVEAKIMKKVETIKIFFTDRNGEKIMKFITYYAMEWTSNVPGGFGWETAGVRWMSFAETQKEMVFASEKKLIQSVHEKN